MDLLEGRVEFHQLTFKHVCQYANINKFRHEREANDFGINKFGHITSKLSRQLDKIFIFFVYLYLYYYFFFIKGSAPKFC